MFSILRTDGILLVEHKRIIMQKTPMNQQLEIANAILTISILAVLTWTVWKLMILDRVRKQFFSSSTDKDLEQVLVDQNRKLNNLISRTDKLNEHLTDLTIANKQDIKKIGFIRFNPFDDAGGNMSFALALLNDDDNGVVISSLHGREGTRIYAKSVKTGKSESKLTTEEQQVIKEAK